MAIRPALPRNFVGKFQLLSLLRDLGEAAGHDQAVVAGGGIGGDAGSDAVALLV